MINIALSIQSELYYDLLAKKLKLEKDFFVIGNLVNINEIINFIKEKNVDIVFFDSLNTKLKLSSLIEEIDKLESNVGLIVQFNYYDLEIFIQSISLGIDACLNNNSTFSDLIQAIRTVKDGGIWAENEVLTSALKRLINKNEKPLKQLSNNLTKREIEIAELIFQGLSNKGIANKLFISDKTVKTHISHIFKKLGIKHRYQLNTHFLDSLSQFKQY